MSTKILKNRLKSNLCMRGLRWASLGRAFLGAGTLLLLAAHPLSVMADSLSIKKIAEYRNPDKVQKVLQEECRIDARLPELIQDEVGRLSLFGQISLIDDPLTAPHEYALVASIITLEAPAGAGWSTGTKFLKVKAILYRNRETVGEFVRSERAVGNNDPLKNATKYRGNCKIVEHLAAEISERLAVWIKKQNIPIKETNSKPSA